MEKVKKAHVTESRRFILAGLTLLLLGAGLLLVCKLPVSEAAATACAFVGGALLLLGNGLIFYGLLVFAGAQNNSPAGENSDNEPSED